MLTGLAGMLLGGQAEGVEAHGVQHVETRHALEAGVDIGGDVAEWVTDVQARSRGVREHVHDEQLRAIGDPERIVGEMAGRIGGVMGAVGKPLGLPTGLELVRRFGVVTVLRHVVGHGPRGYRRPRRLGGIGGVSTRRKEPRIASVLCLFRDTVRFHDAEQPHGLRRHGGFRICHVPRAARTALEFGGTHMSDDDEIDLNALSDEDLTAQMHDDLYDGLGEEIEEGTNILLSRGWDANRVLNDALVEGMRIVGIDFRDGILFVPEVLLAANAMKAGMAILRPLLAETGAEPIGKIVIGTVKGDIHDIGKNLVGMMLEGAGFEVIDLGINTDVDEYLAALEEHKPDILGMSALLTTTMPYMKVVIDTMVERGLRDEYIILVGGAPLNEEFGDAIGADAYCRDAAVAAETASAKVAEKRAA